MLFDFISSPQRESACFREDKHHASWVAEALWRSMLSVIVMTVLSLAGVHCLRQEGWWRDHPSQVLEQLDALGLANAAILLFSIIALALLWTKLKQENKLTAGILHQFASAQHKFQSAPDVPGTRGTEEALKASEERLRLALQSAAMQVWELDLQKDELHSHFANAALASDGGDGPVRLSKALQIVSPEHRERVKLAIDNAIETRAPYQVVYRTVLGRWIASSGRVKLDGNLNPVRLIGVWQDQTGKIESEAALAQLTKLHESILKSTQIGLISVDTEGTVTSWNPAAQRLLGYSAEEVIGRATPGLWHDPQEFETRLGKLTGDEHTRALLRQVPLKGEDQREWIFIRKNGSRIPVRLTITPIYGEDGDLAGFLNQATDISELRLASHQIRDLNDALQNTMSGWAQLDCEGKYRSVNRPYAEAVGYRPDELIGLPWECTVHPEDLPAAVDAYEAMLATGRGEAEVRGMRKDSSTFNKQLFLAASHDLFGNRAGSYCFMRDTTARVEAEHKLEESERRYREFFELNPLPSWIYNPQSLRISSVNEAAIRHYGYTRDQFLAMSLKEIRIATEPDRLEQELGQFVKHSAWRSGPWQHRTSDGRIIDVEIAGRDLSQTARLLVIRDITEQTRAELALRKSEAMLQEAQQIARLGSWELNCKSGTVTWSPETYRIFGLEAASNEIFYAELLALIHSEDRFAVVSAVRHSIQKKQLYDLQFRIVRRDGELRYVHGRGQYSNGSRKCLAGTILDITEQKRIQDELRQSLEEKEVLLKEIHHRVKNNLQVISCLLNMQSAALENGSAVAALQDSERRVMAMALIHERLYGNHRMDRIDFRDYAQTLVEDLIGSYAPSSSQIEGEFSLASIDLTIEQAIPCGLILNELVTNALKYAYPNQTPGVILVDLRATSGDSVLLSVSDHGRGLPESFDSKNSKSLGLTIVHLLTKQLNGTLQIDSSAQGTRFSIEFPKAS